MITAPEHFTRTLDVASNCDYAVNYDVEAQLRNGPFWAGYPAQGFYGYVWFAEEGFYCEIWCFHSHVQTIGPCDSVREIMDKASEQYGYE